MRVLAAFLFASCAFLAAQAPSLQLREIVERFDQAQARATPRSPAPAAASAAAARPGTWKVQPGDTLWQISRESGVDFKELCRLNGIDDPERHKLKIGQELVLGGSRG